MICSNKIEIDSTSSEIEVIVSTLLEGSFFTNVYFYTAYSFKYSIDLSHLLEGESESEAFKIKAEDVGLDNFIGLYYLEFHIQTVKNDYNCHNGDIEPIMEIFPVANLTKYHLCILDNISDIYIEDCEIKYGKNKNINEECTHCDSKLFLKNSFLEALYVAIEYGFTQESVRIIKLLDKLCNDCNCYTKKDPIINLSGIKMGTNPLCIEENKVIKY